MKKILIALIFLTPISWAQEKVVLQLKWFHQFQFAGYYAALEKGFYQEAGFDVEIRERDIKTSVINDVLEGRADFGVADSSIVVSRLKGEPLVIASTIFQSSPLVFLTLSESGITSPYDLRGKKIMFQRSVDDASLTALMEMFDISTSDYQFVPHTFNDWSLTEGKADVMSAYRSNQPFKYRAKGIGYNIIDPANYGIDFYGDLLFTTEQKVKSDRESVNRFVEATHKGWLYAIENQEEISTLIHQKYKKSAEVNSILQEARATESLIKPNVIPLGNVYSERFLRIAQVYKNLGMVPTDGSIDGLLLKDYQPKAFAVDSRVIYAFVAIVLLVLVYLLTQLRFNKRLKVIVKEQTQELKNKNEQLQLHVDSLSKQKQEVEKAKLLAEEASLAKSTFLANMSHEIRTPMNGVLGTLQLLREMPQSEEANDLLVKATYSSKMLLTVINDILDFSKIDARKMHLEAKPFNLDELLDSIHLSLNPQAEEKSITFEITKGNLYRNGWLGDSVRVKQILLNLCSNAVKFTEQGRVELFASCDDKGVLYFMVRDTGIGMNQQAIDRLYNRFEQADSSTTRRFGGTGLGMAICRSLVDMMSGRIHVQSKINYGTTFEVFLPLEESEVSDHIQVNRDNTPPDLTGKKLLLAEDNRINQTIFTKMMKPTNAEIVIAENGQQAVDFLGKSKVDLIFMDIQMPVMDGEQACQIINTLYPGIPVIAVTANVMEEEVSAYLNGGFIYHLGKPLNMEKLYRCCRQFLAS